MYLFVLELWPIYCFSLRSLVFLFFFLWGNVSNCHFIEVVMFLFLLCFPICASTLCMFISSHDCPWWLDQKNKKFIFNSSTSVFHHHFLFSHIYLLEFEMGAICVGNCPLQTTSGKRSSCRGGLWVDTNMQTPSLINSVYYDYFSFKFAHKKNFTVLLWSHLNTATDYRVLVIILFIKSFLKLGTV